MGGIRSLSLCGGIDVLVLFFGIFRGFRNWIEISGIFLVGFRVKVIEKGDEVGFKF